MKALCDNNYENQRPFKNLSLGAVLAILLLGLVLLSISAQAADVNSNRERMEDQQDQITAVETSEGLWSSGGNK